MGRFAVAAVVGLVTGLAWWASVAPAAWSLPVLAGVHLVLALLLAGALRLVSPSGSWGFLGSWTLGMVLVPAALGPLHTAGLLGSKSGFVVDLVSILAGLGLGALLGTGVDRGRRLGLAGLVGAGAVLVGATAAGIATLPTSQQPTAQPAAERLSNQPVAVLGIDGGDWQVLDPMLARGELPVLQSLMDRGSHGVLRSMDPMASPVIWTSIFTGATPTTHGLSDWLRSDARSRRVPTLWDIYAAHGRSSLTVNVPGSWPPPTHLPDGVLLTGFPLPGLAAGDKGQLLGTLLTTKGGSGDVPTRALQAAGSSFSATLPISSPELTPRVEGVLHPVLGMLAREGVLPVSGASVVLTVTPGGAAGQGTLEVDRGAALSLSEGVWSDWILVETADTDAWIRVHPMLLAEGAVELFVSPPFQHPLEPRHTFSVGIDDPSVLVDDQGPYVVEGLGWTAHRDERVAHLVPQMIFDVQDTQVRVAEALLSQRRFDLVSFVFTATDRIQHPFWSLHDPKPYTWKPPASLSGMDPVEDAYRGADAALGRFLEKLPEDVLVFVVSDHGVDPQSGRMDEGEAGHRSDGIWIAAGPGVPAQVVPFELSVVDVTPTVLHCIGAPQADDFDGKPSLAVCPDRDPVASVATYLGEPGTAGPTTVDEEQQAQIKALGYMD